MKQKTSQTQFKGSYVPQEHVMPHSMENREAGSPSAQRKRNSLGLGTQTEARPGLQGLLGRSKITKPTSRGR